MTFDSNGVTGDGTGYGSIALNPLSDLSPTDCGFTALAGGSTSPGFLIGCYDLVGSRHETIMSPTFGSLASETGNTARVNLGASVVDFRMQTITRTGATMSGYVDGTLVESSSPGTTLHPNTNMFILSAKLVENGNAQTKSTKTMRFLAVHAGLDATEVADFSALIQQLQTDLGR